MFEPEELEYADLLNEKRYFVKIARATARRGIVRTYLREQQRVRFLNEKGEIETPDLESLGRMLLLVMTYPDLVSSVVDQQGFDPWPMTPDEFEELPEEFIAQWEAIAYRLNPHWVPTPGSFPIPKKPPKMSIDKSLVLGETQLT